MKWNLIKKINDQSLEGCSYHDRRIKELVRRECSFHCVYCAIHENSLGGIQGFHVEHYRPRKEFPSLENKQANLFYACPICNRFKSKDWPAEPQKNFGNASYPDPSKVDYSIIFQVNEKNGYIQGLYVAAKYMVEKLYFNRPQLILERRRYFLSQDLMNCRAQLKELTEKLKSKNNKKANVYLLKLLELNSSMMDLFLEEKNIPAYEIADVRRK
jgi:hypothetical protein